MDLLGPLADEPYAPMLDYQFLRDVDHTVCTVLGQQIFLKTVGDWVTERCFNGGGQQRGEQRSPSDASMKLSTGWAALSP